MTYEEHKAKFEEMLDRGIQVGDEVEVDEDMSPFIHLNGKKAYKVVLNCMIDLKRGPRYLLCDSPRAHGLIAYCDFPRKKGERVRVVQRFEKSCSIQEIRKVE